MIVSNDSLSLVQDAHSHHLLLSEQTTIFLLARSTSHGSGIRFLENNKSNRFILVTEYTPSRRSEARRRRRTPIKQPPFTLCGKPKLIHFLILYYCTCSYFCVFQCICFPVLCPGRAVLTGGGEAEQPAIRLLSLDYRTFVLLLAD
jgi:hypothetical protein